ncbi:MAG TPA: VWA domain-containing protein [Fibrobacteria bacterium]|nr:VWA domain-containing protein [Fibrobacteria bacterium]
MKWGAPEHLVWLWAVPVLASLLALAIWKRRRDRQKLADAGLIPHVVLHDSLALDIAKAALGVLAAASLVLALARPQWGERLVPAPTKGADLVLVVDASLSMLARDVPPDRLGLARRDLRRLIDSLGPCRIGLVGFAGRGMKQIPLTEDRSALATLLDALSPDLLPYAGTDLGQALSTAAQMLQGPGAAQRLVVLVTDGGDHGKATKDAVKKIQETGATLVVVGVGTDQAVPIQLPEGGVKQDKEGNIVTVRLERETLRDIASSGGGTYLELQPTSWALAPVALAVNQASGQTGKPGFRLEHIDRFPWLLGAAILFLLLEISLPSGRRRKK